MCLPVWGVLYSFVMFSSGWGDMAISNLQKHIWNKLEDLTCVTKKCYPLNWKEQSIPFGPDKTLERLFVFLFACFFFPKRTRFRVVKQYKYRFRYETPNMHTHICMYPCAHTQFPSLPTPTVVHSPKRTSKKNLSSMETGLRMVDLARNLPFLTLCGGLLR